MPDVQGQTVDFEPDAAFREILSPKDVETSHDTRHPVGLWSSACHLSVGDLDVGGNLYIYQHPVT